MRTLFSLVFLIALSGCRFDGKVPFDLSKLMTDYTQTIELEMALSFQDCSDVYPQFEEIAAEFDSLYPITCTDGDYGGVIAFDLEAATKHYGQKPILTSDLLEEELLQFVTWPVQGGGFALAIVGNLSEVNKAASAINIMATISGDNFSDVSLRMENRRGQQGYDLLFPFLRSGNTISDAGTPITIGKGKRLELTLPVSAWDKLILSDAVELGQIQPLAD